MRQEYKINCIFEFTTFQRVKHEKFFSIFENTGNKREIIAPRRYGPLKKSWGIQYLNQGHPTPQKSQWLNILTGLGGRSPKWSRKDDSSHSFPKWEPRGYNYSTWIAKSNRKCLFKENTVIPTAFVQTCFHACYTRNYWYIN